jgi:hypothetical protein
MLRTTAYAVLAEGTVTEKTYGSTTPDGAPEVVAVTFSESTEYQPSSFEGPPARVRHFEIVKVAYVDRVLATFTRCERIMSDVWEDVRYVTVYTDAGDFVDVAVGYKGSFEVDAPAALVAKWEESKKLAAEWAKVRAKVAAEREAVARAKREAATPYRGKTVKVVRGRKVPRGFVGEVIWYGEGKKYGYYGSAPLRVGVKDATGTVHWTDAKNVEVIGTTTKAA